jgi:hypothetical protein
VDDLKFGPSCYIINRCHDLVSLEHSHLADRLTHGLAVDNTGVQAVNPAAR